MEEGISTKSKVALLVFLLAVLFTLVVREVSVLAVGNLEVTLPAACSPDELIACVGGYDAIEVYVIEDFANGEGRVSFTVNGVRITQDLDKKLCQQEKKDEIVYILSGESWEWQPVSAGVWKVK